jgi:allose kinase
VKILGMDIGGTHTRSGFVDENLNIEDFKVAKTQEIFSNASFSDFAAYLKTFASLENLSAISLGFPSTVAKDCRTILSTPNIKGLDNIAAADILERQFNVPVFINRDVNLLLLSDINALNIEKHSIVLGFYVGTGLGNAIFINGEILAGKNGSAGELGHIPVLGRKDLCGCGNLGCMELYSDGKYLSKIHKEFFSQDDISKLFAKYSAHPKVEEFLDNLAAAMAIEINIFDPDEILIGGGVISMENFPKEKLETAIKKYARKPFPAQNLALRYAQSANNSGVLGAAIFGFQKLSINKERR